jgi:phosphoglycerol transferase MdoB-like AlkP superfamily enzyme
MFLDDKEEGRRDQDQPSCEECDSALLIRMNHQPLQETRRFYFCVLYFVLSLAIPLLGRAALLVTRWADLGGTAILDLLVIGTRLDAVVAGAAALPLFLLALVLPSKTWCRQTLLWIGALVLAFLAFSELGGWFFFSYFDFRPNYLILEHGADPEILYTMSAAYPWVRVLLAVLIFGFVSHRVLARFLRATSPRKLHDRLATAGLFILACLCIRGTFDHRALNPSFATFSSNRLANEIAGNGVLNVAYELLQQRKENYVRVQDVAGRMSLSDAFMFAKARLESTGTFLENTANPLLRLVEGARQKNLNVVVVVMEGFTARLAGAWGGELSLTPSCDRWAARGLIFENCIATGERTVQGLEAVLSSYPPLPGMSVVRRPQTRGGNFATLASTMKGRGYDTVFYYGGQGIFDHMKGFFLANGYDRFVEESDYDDVTFHSSWGVSDQDVFRRLDRDLTAHHEQGKPLFATFLTVSFHSPFKYPAGKSPEIPQGTNPPSGFKAEELNNFLYADWAVGDFLDKASTRDYFRNTIFVFVGDHGIHLRGNDLVPVDQYRVVSFVLAPGLKPRRMSQPISQMDIAPTVLGLLGGEWKTPFFGRDVLAPNAHPPRALMIYNKRRYGVIEGNDFVIHSETATLPFHVLDKFRLEPAEMTPEHARILNEGLGTLHAADELLRKRSYRDSD